MKKQLKVGDRVKFEWSTYAEPQRWLKGTIQAIDPNGKFEVLSDMTAGNVAGQVFKGVKPRLCIRLNKKPLREFEINLNPSGNIRGVCFKGRSGISTLGAFFGDNETVLVREVRSKERK